MRLSQALTSQVPAGSRSRGAEYFLSGAVRAMTVENGVVQATVRGGDSYTVWIECVGTLLRASCTCPYFIDRGDICKHVWAVILAAEAQSVPLVPAGVSSEDVDLEPLYPEDDGDLDDEDDAWLRAAPPPRATATLQKRQPPPPPQWRQLIDSVSTANAPPASLRPRLATGQLLYVIDGAASASSGTVVVELMTRDRKVNGEWGKPRPGAVTTADVHSHPDVAERHILERLFGPRIYQGWAAGQDYAVFSRLQVRGVLASEIVPLLCATGRCMFRPGSAPGSLQAAPVPLAWDEAGPWRCVVEIRHAGADSRSNPGADAGTDPVAGYVIDGHLARDGERMALTDPLLVLADGLLFTQTHAARMDVGDDWPWLSALRRAGPVSTPPEAREELIEALLANPSRTLAVPDDLRVEIVQGEPRPHLRLRPMKNRRDRLRAEVGFDYEGALVAVESPQRAIRTAGSMRAIQRDLEAEQRALRTLHQRGCRREWSYEDGHPVLQLPTTTLPRIAHQLLGDGWHVEASGLVYRRPGPSSLAVRSGIDWFELHGHVDYDGATASLPDLLAALDRGETFVRLDDGSLGLLPEEWLRRHATLARLGSADGDHLRFTKSQVALLDALIASQPEASWDDTFTRARAELQTFEGVHPADPPSTFTGTLRGYQRDGLGWLLFLRRFGFGGCLADDMGLGKTVMVLALLAERHETSRDDHRPSLVVAPRSVVFNWRQEAARFTPGLRVLEYVGSGRAAMRDTFGRHDVILTTYGTLRRDVEVLSAVPFDYIVLDEAQAIKNASSVSAKSTRVLNARYRLALSGTPIENHLGELWSLFEFLNPGLLSTAASFARVGAGARLDDEAVALVAKGLRPFILRRTKQQVAADLPRKTEQTLYCELERPQRLLYDQLRTHYRHTLLEGSGAGSFGRAKIQVLTALLRLRQAACHPGLIDPARAKEASAKLDVLVPRLLEAVEEGHKTLVFSQFTSLLALLRTRLDESGTTYEYLDGRTRDRQSKVERFQSDPECRLFLISLKAGGLGLNLTAAEYVFLLDPWWNPAVEAQAIDRAHRIGQARQVFAYRLIARDTVEERVLELQQKKRQLADAILSADNSVLRDLRREDLELLLS